MRFPAFARRMTPDALDHISGAWGRTVDQAREQELKEKTNAVR